MSRGAFGNGRIWYTPRPKRPPPQHGIKVKGAGGTWWGRRWIEALEAMSMEYDRRLSRGLAYARAGRTHDLVVAGGLVTARVTGTRATPYKVTIRVAELPRASWERAIQAMAERAQFAAELLSGQMPEDIDEVFRASGVSLFPTGEAELATQCSCPDWANPCKHIAATHYVLGEALDRDPFLLFELRGRAKDAVLAALRAARVGGGVAKEKRRGRGAGGSGGEVAIPNVRLAKLTAKDYDRPREALPGLGLSFDAPVTHAASLRQLGAPAAWRSESSPAELLAPLVRAAAEKARRMALAEPAEDDDKPVKVGKRV